MKKQKTPTQPHPRAKMITVSFTYRLKHHKEVHPYQYITLTTNHNKKQIFRKIKKHFKMLYKEIGCKMLSCKMTSWIDTEYHDRDPITFTKSLEVFK